jgi:hypothetical protein
MVVGEEAGTALTDLASHLSRLVYETQPMDTCNLHVSRPNIAGKNSGGNSETDQK